MLCCDNQGLVVSAWNIWEHEIMSSRIFGFSAFVPLSSTIYRVATLFVDQFSGFSTVVTSLRVPTNSVLDFRATRYTKPRKSFGLRSLLTILYGYKNLPSPTQHSENLQLFCVPKVCAFPLIGRPESLSLTRQRTSTQVRNLPWPPLFSTLGALFCAHLLSRFALQPSLDRS